MTFVMTGRLRGRFGSVNHEPRILNRRRFSRKRIAKGNTVFGARLRLRARRLLRGARSVGDERDGCELQATQPAFAITGEFLAERRALRAPRQTQQLR
jgi:hypothetical protein